MQQLPGKTNVTVLAVFLFALPLAGLVGDLDYFRYALCRVAPGFDESARIKATVLEFNNRLMDVYASQGVQRAADPIPATTGMRHRLFKDAGFIGMGGKVLVYDLASLEVREVKRSGPFAATAVASEDWNYQYKNDMNWQSVGELHGTGALVRYHLVKQRGKWLVRMYEPIRGEKKGA